ncbi:hypothetical protein NCF86_01600 [Pelagerythrobacter marinus]|nr:hypothetical protein NCF86_01600 [Pelagerythrobacter marinus]
MSDYDFEHVTTDAAVTTYDTVKGVFEALLKEVRELSKKKPDATLSGSKVKLINKVLEDLLTILGEEPEGKYLEPLEDEQLPQVSDALMMMVQFEAALNAFHGRYYEYVEHRYFSSDWEWVTEENVETWKQDHADMLERIAAEEDEEEEYE